MSPCKQGCLNGDSGYICQCNNRHILAADGITCIKCASSNNPTWHVALCNASNDDTICSGTAINDQWVLTSARCACNKDKQSLSIRFRKNRTCSYRDPNELQLSASEIYCYSNFTNTLTTDIAAIKLQTPIPTRAMKRSPPLCIHNARKGKHLFYFGKNVETFGWGKIGTAIEKEAILESTGSIVVDTTKNCKKVFREESVQTYNTNTLMMCTIANASSACTGNYGSAVVARSKKAVYFGGIMSRSTLVCGAANSYLAHSKLYAQVAFDWITSTIRS